MKKKSHVSWHKQQVFFDIFITFFFFLRLSKLLPPNNSICGQCFSSLVYTADPYPATVLLFESPAWIWITGSTKPLHLPFRTLTSRAHALRRSPALSIKLQVRIWKAFCFSTWVCFPLQPARMQKSFKTFFFCVCAQQQIAEGYNMRVYWFHGRWSLTSSISSCLPKPTACQAGGRGQSFYQFRGC